MQTERVRPEAEPCLGMLGAVSWDPSRELGPRLPRLVFSREPLQAEKGAQPSDSLGSHRDASQCPKEISDITPWEMTLQVVSTWNLARSRFSKYMRYNVPTSNYRKSASYMAMRVGIQSTMCGVLCLVYCQCASGDEMKILTQRK